MIYSLSIKIDSCLSHCLTIAVKLHSLSSMTGAIFLFSRNVSGRKPPIYTNVQIYRNTFFHLSALLLEIASWLYPEVEINSIACYSQPTMKTTRAFAIAQLCIAFTILLWHLSQPFVGDLFRAKAQILVFEEAMKDRVRYEGLPEEDRLLIAEGYDRAQRQIGLPFTTKLEQSFSGLIYKVSPYELAWIVLSIVVPILLLKQVDGARLAVWLIPLVSILYVVDNQYYGVEMGPTAHERLFPERGGTGAGLYG